MFCLMEPVNQLLSLYPPSSTMIQNGNVLGKPKVLVVQAKIDILAEDNL